ncbi:hypothetical protein [Sphingopyxis indica]|nr:hypothetical protein [Sphingopyxis indica]
MIESDRDTPLPPNSVIPAKAGISPSHFFSSGGIPAFAGMTIKMDAALL